MDNHRDGATLRFEAEGLHRELAEARADLAAARREQAAAADVLRIVSQSVADAAPVFDAILEACLRLFSPYGAAIYLVDGDMVRGAARRGFSDGDWGTDATPLAGSSTGRAITESRPIHIADLAGVPGLPEDKRMAVQAYGGLTTLYAPMMSGERGVGSLVVARRPKRPFSESEIASLGAFADQAVIAIENARLFREMEESLAQQTATADVLKAINRSAFDSQAVLEALINSAVSLTGSTNGLIWRFEDGMMHARAFAQGERRDAFIAYMRAHPQAPGRNSTVARIAKTGQVQNIADVLADLEFPEDLRRAIQTRATLGVPMKRGDDLVGAIVMSKPEAGAYPERIVNLVKTFADQAVIAIENARLFGEVQARTQDLSDSLEYQTAISNVLGIISRSPNEVQPVFDTIVATARVLCLAERAVVWSIEGSQFRPVAFSGMDSSSIEKISDHRLPTGSGSVAGQAAAQGRAVQLLDASVDASVGAQQHELARAGNICTILAVPLMNDGVATGCLTLSRAVVQRFDDRQIGLLQTFADQAVIAIKNVRLFREVQTRTRELEQSLADLRKAQDRLVQSEKLASLAQLTAGIAHEIKNPLNFVNNFAELSRDLIAEMKEAPARGERTEVEELAGLIDANLEKVVHHGKRADSIVKNMLLHSREGSGERSRVNVNAMIEEALSLGYHGARAENPGFQVTIEKALDPECGEAELYLQEITRVLLNLIANGFYASAKRREVEGPDYQPTLKASTRSLGDRIEIRIRDNGVGVPDEVRAKIFNPFFTTKPAGEGTGLGLSLSHDIVVKQHGGTIEVETAPGEFTEFIVTLPKGGAVPRTKGPSHEAA